MCNVTGGTVQYCTVQGLPGYTCVLLCTVPGMGTVLYPTRTHEVTDRTENTLPVQVTR